MYSTIVSQQRAGRETLAYNSLSAAPPPQSRLQPQVHNIIPDIGVVLRLSAVYPPSLGHVELYNKKLKMYHDTYSQ
ncbi:hypothetical protein J6590_032293 [Homalodisca vitripennis]|nr:hypothetical protein J6590_032293 [Homalodisca vitripennis]